MSRKPARELASGYSPLLCGDCVYFSQYDDDKRTPDVSGFCEWLALEVYRADFCHRQDQIDIHEKAKEAYVPDYHGKGLYHRHPKLPGGW